MQKGSGRPGTDTAAALQWGLLDRRLVTSVAPAVIHRHGMPHPLGLRRINLPGGAMAQHDIPEVPVWAAVLDELIVDDRVTPQLHGFLNLAVPQGVMSGTLYLDVPNDLTAAQINKRMRAPILEALARVPQSEPVATTFRVAGPRSPLGPCADPAAPRRPRRHGVGPQRLAPEPEVHVRQLRHRPVQP